jgi:medium-chain acyl-[acyl-carrier-protein] hydrolase
MKNVSERIAALSPDKQAMLLQRLRQKTGQPATIAPPTTGTQLPHISPDGWIVRYRQNEGARLRLFCFSYAGGGASIFRQWPDLLPQDVEVCAIQLPGREYRLAEPAYTNLDSLIEALADAIAPYLDRPFAFFGHSMGSLVCFELARQLRRTHDKHPVHLYIGAYRAPHLPNPNVKIYHLPLEVFKVILRADGIPERILQNEELMQAMLPTLRADFELCDTHIYKEEAPLQCSFSIFGGQEDNRISPAELDAWRIHSSALCSLSLLPGSHFFLHSAQDLLLSTLSQDLGAQLSAFTQAYECSGPSNLLAR